MEVADMAQSVQAAKCLVDEIWREHTFDGTIDKRDSFIGRSLQNAIEVLSDQLYEKETHFLLELIQNADDNQYLGEVPTIKFTYKKGSLRIDCNEIGFTENDVKALCSIGQSTKTGLGRSTQYIGEKGIGFKSVFKVASVVYVSSGPFSFKFDQSETMGQIAPLWAEFPEPTLPGHTSFYLQLSEGCNEEVIVQELRNLDPTLLIFLRKLKKIRLLVVPEYGYPWERSLWREDIIENGRPVAILHKEHQVSRYVIIKHQVLQLPREDKRESCPASEVLLAFPILDIQNPRIEKTHSVYSFLPIRDYGFKFLLQGDFLLTANREDVINCLWNQTIRDAAADAFVTAIDYFNSGPQRYNWPYYLPTENINGFFQPLKDLILQKLSNALVLESCASVLATPPSLTYILPYKFLCEGRIPFTLHEKTAPRYLSLKYSSDVGTILSELGTKTLDAVGFLQDLNWIISNDPHFFREKPSDWHSQLTETLLTLAADEQNRLLISEMDIIPLRNGEWTAPRNDSIYFSRDLSAVDIPRAVQINIVDPIVQADFNRKSLFTHLGVKFCPEANQICHQIVKLHNSDTFDPYLLTRDELLSHVKFMFNSSFQPPEGTSLWFATTKGGRAKGSRCYMHEIALTPPDAGRHLMRRAIAARVERNLRSQNVASEIRKHLETEYPFIHEIYTDANPDSPGWLGWLKRAFGLATRPRIRSIKTDLKGNFSLSEEFKFLFRTYNTSDVLQLLKGFWHEYSGSVLEAENIRDQIASMKVKCYWGQSTNTCSVPLREAFLPGIDKFVDESSHVPMLVVSDPGDPSWHMLENFGVAVNKGFQYYFKCLQSMRLHSPPKDVVTHVYRKVQVEYDDNERFIKKAFMTQRLVYVRASLLKASSEMRWITGKECIEQNVDIVSEYHRGVTLFRDLFEMGSSNIKRLLKAAIMIEEGASLNDRLQTLVGINRALQVWKTEDARRAFETLNAWVPIFPILQGRNGNEYDGVAPLKPAFPPWFIADRHHLRDSFLGQVDLLAFEPEDLDLIEEFLKVLDTDSRRLSRIVTSKASPSGKPKRNKAYTMALRDKVPYISALIPKSRPNRIADIEKLCRVEVSIAPRIVQTHTFSYGSREFTGKDMEGEVALSVRNGRLEIFMTRENISAPLPPPELVNEIIHLYEIINPIHRDLIQFALGESSLERLWNAFRREGIHVSESSLEDEVGIYATLRRGEFLDITLSGDEADDAKSNDDGIMSKFQHIPAAITEKFHDEIDRRLPSQAFKWSQRFLYRNTVSDPTVDYRTVLRKEPAHAQYLAEMITSRIFQIHLGTSYDPELHWTSPLRVRAGYSMFPYTLSTHAPFIIADRETSDKCTEFLIGHGYSEATKQAWKESSPAYHFDVAVSSGDSGSEFPWTTQQFERMRKFRTENQLGSRDNPKLENVHVLVRITDAFKKPKLRLFVDPWRMFISDGLVFQNDWALSAAIIGDYEHDLQPQEVSCQSSIYTQNTQSLPPPASIIIARSPIHNKCPKKVGSHCPNNLVDATPGRTITAQTNGYFDTDNSSTFRNNPPEANSSLECLNIRIPPEGLGTTSSYLYKPLNKDSIRLIMLHPGSKDTELRAVVFHSPLLLTSSFQAISYTWNKGILSHSLWTPEGSIAITASLYAALRSLRHEKEALTLWADGVCIHQKDTKEKMEQIRLVPQVFQRATCVMAYLGDDDKDRNALEVLMQIRVNEALSTLGEEWPKDLAPIPSDWAGKRIPPSTSAVWGDIGAIFDRPWFQRAWIIQEVVAAVSVRVICGSWMIDWNDLLTAIEIIKRESQVPCSDALATAPKKWERFLTLAAQREREARHDRRPLLELLEDFRSAKATLDHDRFFCLLGIAIDGNNPDFVLDYEVSFASVVRKYAWAFIRQGKVMELLHRAGISSRPSEQFPTWIPDWTVIKPDCLRSLAHHGMPCAASTTTQPRIDFNPAANEFELGVHGIIADTIKVVSKVPKERDSLHGYFNEVDRMIKIVHPDHDDDVRCQVPIANTSYLRSGGISMKDSYAALRRYAKETRSKKGTADERNEQDETTESLWTRGQNYYLALQDLPGWKLIVTEMKYIGIAPANAQRGDLVSILDGGVVPFLIRKSKKGKFQLVGECYIHGLMNGEASELGAVKEVIVLR